MSPADHTSQEISRLRRELEAARRISETLFQHSSVEVLIEKALQSAVEEVDAETGSVLLANPETKELVFRYCIGATPVPKGTAIPWDQGIAGSVFKSGKPAIISDVKKSIQHFKGVDEATGFKTRDMITLPLKRWEGEPIGVMNVLNKRHGVLNEDDLALLTIISAFAAVSIQQARLFEEAKLAEVVHRLGDIGHDLKNLQTPVVMGTSLLRDEVKELFVLAQNIAGKEGEAYYNTCNELIDMVRDGAQRTQDRVKEIADCVKGLSSPPNFQPCHVSSIVESVIKTLGVLADEKRIRLVMKDLTSLPTILADERRLFNAVYNLINNAIPEVPTGGSITVSGATSGISEPNQSIVLSVADTGRGMPPEVRNSLFSSHAISRKAGGTGLGTKIIKDVVDAHGGTITVDSTEGVGTTFQMRLPITPPQAQAAG
jgi:signal transduction histidine kinase